MAYVIELIKLCDWLGLDMPYSYREIMILHTVLGKLTYSNVKLQLKLRVCFNCGKFS